MLKDKPNPESKIQAELVGPWSNLDVPAGCLFIGKFGLREFVYLKTDIEQTPRQITDVEFKGGGSVIYWVACGTVVSSHYDFELTREEDILKKTL